MLRELHIVNLAVIAEARVDLSAGLNCFTGATGAGKSLVIGAINVLLGAAGAGDFLRKGADEGHVTGVFAFDDPSRVQAVRAAADVPLDDEEARAGELIVTRRFFASGRTRVTINANPVTLAQLRAVGGLLVDVHGQHDTAYLLKPSNQLDVLDAYAGTDADRKAYAAAWESLQASRRRLEALTQGQELRRQTGELYRFQLDEIDQVAPDAAEYATLEARAGVLENLESLRTDATGAFAELYDGDATICDRLKRLSKVLASAAAVDARLKDVADTLAGSAIAAEEAARDLGRYLDRLESDPEELADVNTRLTAYGRLLHKYGPTLGDLMAFRADVAARAEALSRQTDDLSELTARIAPLSAQVAASAAKLSARRRKAAASLGPVIEGQLGELGMEKARFRVDVSPTPDGRPGPSGADVVEFVAQTNPGLDAQPLRRIASGGELSRIMLALKQVLTRDDTSRVSVLVFDEIDANIGGRLAAVVGGKLRSLAAKHQILCITHLPQIAAYADLHLTVRKDQTGDRTRTTIAPVEGDVRLAELAEMIGGKVVTQTTRDQARELIDAARGEPLSPPAAKPRGRRRAS